MKELYRDDLRNERFTNPRRKLPRSPYVYLRDNITRRPLFAVHQLAIYSEARLARARERKVDTETMRDVEFLFIEIRRLQRNVLALGDNGALSSSRCFTPSMREKASLLLAAARAIEEKLGDRAAKCICPFCAGKGKIRKGISVIFRAIVRKAIEDGLIPADYAY